MICFLLFVSINLFLVYYLLRSAISIKKAFDEFFMNFNNEMFLKMTTKNLMIRHEEIRTNNHEGK